MKLGCPLFSYLNFVFGFAMILCQYKLEERDRVRDFAMQSSFVPRYDIHQFENEVI